MVKTLKIRAGVILRNQHYKKNHNMFRLPQLSLSSVPFYTSIVVVAIQGIFIGCFWAFNEYQAYQQSVVDIRVNYEQQYKERVREEQDKIIDFIEYKRSQQHSGLERKIREKVQSAYSIASHIHSFYKDRFSLEEQRKMVVELLRPVRWDNGLGYYFAGRVSTGAIDLFADKPWFEGENLPPAEKGLLQPTVASIVQLVRERGGGALRYNWFKPEAGEQEYVKIAYVKHFQPFDWFMGAGAYLDDVQIQIQESVIERIQRLSFGKEGEILVFRKDGTILCSNDATLSGRALTTLKSDERFGFIPELLALLDSGKDSGFYEYTAVRNDDDATVERLGFMKVYPEWDWVIATSISKVEMEKAIADETATYAKIAYENSILFILLFILAVILLLIISNVYSMTIRQSMNHFTAFFRQAAESHTQVDKKQLRFRELQELGDFANRMSEDRSAKEKVIRRDERRLDTLLQLGFMDGSSLREMYDFTLQRIVEITESRAGYFLIIEKAKPLIQSLVIREGNVSRLIRPDLEKPAQQKYDATLQKIIDNKEMLIQSEINKPSTETFFPIDETVLCRVDVPLLENDGVVAILGLCNKGEIYGDEDTRQITLLLEGMWLHRNRVVVRKEMIKLRQLLKNMTDSMPSMLIGIDKTFRVIQWNRSAEERLGVTAEMADGCLLSEVLPRAKKHEKQIKQVISSGRQIEIPRVPDTTESGVRYETLTIYPLIFGEEKGAVLRFDDVTERVAMEEMVIQSEKMVSVGGLAAGIAHEINNPLASVKQNLQVVKKRLQSDLPQNHGAAEQVGVRLEDIHKYLEKRGIRHMLDIIDTDSTRAVKLVHNMLAFSRKSASAFTSVDVCALLDRALEFSLADYDLRKNYNFKKIRIDKEYQAELKEVQCEETNIQQVFLNIIRNAVHAMAENSDSNEPPRIILRVKADGEMARVEIEDNGCGMDQNISRKIFEPFYTTKAVGKGTGLGLSISYYIVTSQHNGVLRVESVPGQGSVFTICLPFQQNQQS